MKHLRHIAELNMRSSDDLVSVREAMFASMFYFELEDLPVWDGDSYKCVGTIFCRMNLSMGGREALYKELFTSPYYFLVDGRPTRCVELIPKGIPLFRKRIEFRAPDMDYDVSISIGGSINSHYISGMPKRLNDLVSCQRLQAPFGRINHQFLGNRLPPLPLNRKRTRVQSGEFF